MAGADLTRFRPCRAELLLKLGETYPLIREEFRTGDATPSGLQDWRVQTPTQLDTLCDFYGISPRDSPGQYFLPDFTQNFRVKFFLKKMP